jgi:hypothetical protein
VAAVEEDPGGDEAGDAAADDEDVGGGRGGSDEWRGVEGEVFAQEEAVVVGVKGHDERMA